MNKKEENSEKCFGAFLFNKHHTIWGVAYGACSRTRTGDLLITSEMHYQLCYTSIFCSGILTQVTDKVNSLKTIKTFWWV